VSSRVGWRSAAACVVAISAAAAFAACGGSSGESPSSPVPDATASDGPAFDAPGLDAPSPLGDAGSDAPPSDAGEAGSDDLGPLADFCTSYAKAVCDREAYCESAPDAACVPRTLAQCHWYARAQMNLALTAGVIAFDAVKAASCFAQTSFDDYCVTRDLFHLVGCQGIFTGTRALGRSCVRVYMFGEVDECQGGACSAGEVSGTCGGGVCGPFLDAGAACVDDAGSSVPPGCGPGMHCMAGACVAEGKPGDPCGDPTWLCRSLWPQLACAPVADGGLECAFARDAGGACGVSGTDVDEVCRSQLCVNGQCADKTADGGIACASPSPPCPAGTACQANGKTDPPSCRAPIAAGGACSAGAVCAAGSECNGSVCVALPGDAGAPCVDGCGVGLACSHFKDAGACRAVVPSGGACGGAGDDVCAPGLTCSGVTSTCTPPASVGVACTVDSDCDAGLYCDGAARVCRTWKANGAPCTRDGECIFGTGCGASQTCASACTVPLPYP
jgi:hypothetical protein